MSKDSMLYYQTIEQSWEGGFLITNIGWQAPEGFDTRTREWFQNAIKNHSDVIYTAPYTDLNSGKICVTLSYRVLDKNGRQTGVCAADIVLDALSQAVNEINISENSRVHIITKDGLYITNDDFSAIMTKNYFDDISFKSYTKEAYLDGTTKAFIEGSQFFGVHPIDNTDWFIVTEGLTSDFSKEYTEIISQQKRLSLQKDLIPFHKGFSQLLMV